MGVEFVQGGVRRLAPSDALLAAALGGQAMAELNRNLVAFARASEQSASVSN